MSALSPEAARFLYAAVGAHIAAAARAGQAPSLELRTELADVVAALVDGSRWVSTGHEGSPRASTRDSAQAGRVVRGDPHGDGLAVGLDEAGRLLGVSRSTVKRRIAAGDLTSTTIGRRRVIPRAAIDELLGGVSQ